MNQHYNSQEAQKFFCDLQADLLKDRQEEHWTASPLYYGIMDNKPTVTAEGYEDFVSFYNSETCESVDTLEELFQLLKDEDNLDCLIENAANANDYYPTDLYDHDTQTILKPDIDIWQEALEDMGWTPIYMQDNYHIKENFLALTRKAAKQHLQSNAHHYTDKATTYAMHGWRSPQFEKLIELLHQIDWSHSTLAFRIPKCMFYTKEEMEAHMDAYLQFCKYPKQNQAEVRQAVWKALLSMDSLTENGKSFYLIDDVKSKISQTVRPMLEDSNSKSPYENLPGATIFPLFITLAEKEAMTMPGSGTVVLNYYYELPYYNMKYNSDGTDITLQLFEREREETFAITLPVNDFINSQFLTFIDSRFQNNNKHHVVFAQPHKEA